MSEFKLPDLGEGLQEAEIVEWKVKSGDRVELDELVVVVETAKAIVEIPSPVSAVVIETFAEVGELVEVGAALFSFDVEQKTDVSSPLKCEHQVQEEKSVSVVGRLQEAGSTSKSNAYEGAIVALDHDALPQKFHLQKNRRDAENRSASTPSILAFAKKLGLEDHLKEHQYAELTESDLLELYEEKYSGNNNLPSEREHILKLSGARKVMAQSMTKSHQHIPSVTLFDDADISHWKKGEDITLRVIQALVEACKTVPLLNAWFDEEALSVQMFDDIHLGVAVNANDGLFVPVIRSVQNLKTDRIREILNKQISQVEARSIKPQKLLGATISLSNFGTLSGKYATPIIVPPQVAIVGVGKISMQAVVRDNELAVGRLMPLSLSFDHRAASGADAAAFMSQMIVSLET